MRMNIRKCSCSASPNTNRRSTTRESRGCFAPLTKQPPEEEAARRLDGEDGVKCSDKPSILSGILPWGHPPFAAHAPFLLPNPPRQADTLLYFLSGIFYVSTQIMRLLSVQAIPFRRSLKLHKAPFAAAPSPFIFLAPSLRFDPNRSRALAKASFTNSLLPITAPAVK